MRTREKMSWSSSATVPSPTTDFASPVKELVMLLLNFNVLSIRAKHPLTEREAAVTAFNDPQNHVQVLVMSVKASEPAEELRRRYLYRRPLECPVHLISHRPYYPHRLTASLHHLYPNRRLNLRLDSASDDGEEDNYRDRRLYSSTVTSIRVSKIAI